MTADIRKYIALVEQSSTKISAPVIKRPKEDEQDRVKELIKLATKDKFAGPVVASEPKSLLRAMYFETTLVGLCWPKRDSDGRYSIDLIFIDPAYRNKGIASQFLKSYYNDRKGRAYIEPDNKASIQAFLNAGFKKKEGGTKQGSTLTHEFDQYLKD